MSRSPEQPPRWPKPPRSRPLALCPEDFDPPARRGAVDLQRRMDAWAGGVIERLADLGVDTTVAAREQDVDAKASPSDDAKASPSDDAKALSSGESPLPVVRFVLRGAGSGATRLVLAMDALRVRAGLELPASRARVAR